MTDKFCKDCKHRTPDDRCRKAPMIGDSDALAKWMVTGSGPRPDNPSDYYACFVERKYDNIVACGIEGKNWEPIEKCPECGGKGSTETIDGPIRCGTCKEAA